MLKSANPFRRRIFALACLIAALSCSRANPPVPTAGTSTASGTASAAKRDPGHSATEASPAPAVAVPSAAVPSATVPSAAMRPTSGATATPPPAARPAPQAPASHWTRPQDCSVYDTSPDYRALSAQDRAHGRLTCETKEEFRAFVASRQRCKAAADCTIVAGSCPFDCYVPIAKSEEREVRAKLDSLAARLDKAGNRCMYGCIGSPQVECVGGRCDAGNR